MMNLSHWQGNRPASIISAFGNLPEPILLYGQIYCLFSNKLFKPESLDNAILELYSKIQLVVYYLCCVLIGWATTKLYVIAH